MTYFNTTLEAGAELARYRDTALRQEERIRLFFAETAEFLYTPSQVLAHVFPNEGVPITSVRRAMTNLTSSGLLVKSDRKRIGIYGRPEYCWFRRVRPRQLDLLATEARA